ncbi:MAG: FKBP-type peptidyl-prolyl cis-trans isomerase [Propionibacteriales bacterium]|nr:FKBP-type peptidyl-prolyl cis-trans isomerase [Propionibacteriales bacterium]
MLNRRALALALIPMFALAGCGAPAATSTPTPGASSVVPTPSPSPSASVPVRTNLDEIKVSGAWLKLPKVTFPAPFAIDKTQAKVLIAGKGAEVTADGVFTFRYYLASGPTGKKLEESFSSKSDFTTAPSGLIKGFQTGLVGKRAGSRVLLAIPGPDAYDAQGGSPDGSIKVGDTLVFVVDILGAAVSQPSGKVVTPPKGLPTVAGAAADKPTVTMPGTAAPTSMSAVSLIAGTGPKVAKGDTISVRYVGYSWKTGALVDDQWTPTDGLLSSTIPGWQTGLLGKAVGSRVMLVLPPKDGYPEGSNNPPLEAGDTIVYVIDILYSYKASA